jgi:hypothetical protein
MAEVVSTVRDPRNPLLSKDRLGLPRSKSPHNSRESAQTHTMICLVMVSASVKLTSRIRKVHGNLPRFGQST